MSASPVSGSSTPMRTVSPVCARAVTPLPSTEAAPSAARPDNRLRRVTGRRTGTSFILVSLNRTPRVSDVDGWVDAAPPRHGEVRKAWDSGRGDNRRKSPGWTGMRVPLGGQNVAVSCSHHPTHKRGYSREPAARGQAQARRVPGFRRRRDHGGLENGSQNHNNSRHAESRCPPHCAEGTEIHAAAELGPVPARPPGAAPRRGRRERHGRVGLTRARCGRPPAAVASRAVAAQAAECDRLRGGVAGRDAAGLRAGERLPGNGPGMGPDVAEPRAGTAGQHPATHRRRGRRHPCLGRRPGVAGRALRFFRALGMDLAAGGAAGYSALHHGLRLHGDFRLLGSIATRCAAFSGAGRPPSGTVQFLSGRRSGSQPGHLSIRLPAESRRLPAHQPGL